MISVFFFQCRYKNVSKLVSTMSLFLSDVILVDVVIVVVIVYFVVMLFADEFGPNALEYC